jgi:hypothetical protein
MEITFGTQEPGSIKILGRMREPGRHRRMAAFRALKAFKTASSSLV